MFNRKFAKLTILATIFTIGIVITAKPASARRGWNSYKLSDVTKNDEGNYCRYRLIPCGAGTGLCDSKHPKIGAYFRRINVNNSKDGNAKVGECWDDYWSWW